ncbi:hypothetical protein [Thalassobius sp. Cn5-15]|uniref:hypothetical protein n=1 Tax=Thalassobius sp. Cn5-15 TaxID=2917763 RepID=UPI001EF2DBB3|nr:hypothetical protein [Thalassobius sp. Cn5-15]MCG7492979.1 hypothetical protein [Thalassobius sp. Cn5-15]
MPKLIRLYITNVLIGFAIAAAFVAMLLWFNLGNLGSLVANSDVGLLAVFLLWFSNGIIFAGVQFGIAVMKLKEDEPKSGGGRAVRVDLTKPVRVMQETAVKRQR